MIGSIVLAALVGAAMGSLSLALALILGVPGWIALTVVGAACASVLLLAAALR